MLILLKKTQKIIFIKGKWKEEEESEKETKDNRKNNFMNIWKFLKPFFFKKHQPSVSLKKHFKCFFFFKFKILLNTYFFTLKTLLSVFKAKNTLKKHYQTDSLSSWLWELGPEIACEKMHGLNL